MVRTEGTIYQIRITLLGVEPDVWRRVLLRAGISFFNLHEIIQAAMGWENEHEFSFMSDDTHMSEEFEIDKYMDGGQKVIYSYGTGSHVWHHSLELEDTLTAEPGMQYPICTAGGRACPDEDADTSEYSDKAQKDGKLHLLSEYREDAEYFDPDHVNEDLFLLAAPEDGYIEPSIAQWNRLYEMAIRIRDMKPWTTLQDSETIAVLPPGAEEMVYYVTFGSVGEMRAIAAFPGNRALASMEKIRERAAMGAPLAALGIQNSVMCYFGSREEVSTEDKAVLRELGLRFRGGGQWVYFRSYRPGYAPWRIDANEADLLIRTMEQYAAAVTEYAFRRGRIDAEGGEVLLRRYSEQSAAWLSETISPRIEAYHPEPFLITDDLYIARLKRQKRAYADIELDVIYMPTPVQEYRGMRPYFPKLVLIVGKNDAMVLEQSIVQPNDTVPILVHELLESMVLEFGLPRSLSVRDNEAALMVADWCDKLGVRLHCGGDMPALNETVLVLMTAIGLDG